MATIADVSPAARYLRPENLRNEMKRLIPRSRFAGKPDNSDSVKSRIRRSGTSAENRALLERAREAWLALDGVRLARLRNFRYVFGDQWGDTVRDGRGGFETERDRIERRTGGIALQNNHLIKVVNTLAGLYDKTATMPVCYAVQDNASEKSRMMTSALQANWVRNQEKTLVLSEVYELLCGGMAVCVEEWGTHEGVEDSYTYPVDPSHFFFSSKANDPRHWDVDLIGEIRDYTLGELASELAESRYDYRQLEEIYGPYTDIRRTPAVPGEHGARVSWDTPQEDGLCRTYRIWTLEHKERIRCVDIMDTARPLYKIEVSQLPLVIEENGRRLEEGRAAGLPDSEIPLIEYSRRIDQYWHFQMLAPDGRVLAEYDSPYEHGGHPYVFRLHHFVNGRIYPFIGVIIDQQRYINRLITLHDLAIQNAAKGLKLIPKNVLGDLSPREFARRFVEIGEFIFYEPDPKMPNVKPEVLTTNATNIGTAELLSLEIGFINDISSVSESLQGKSPASGTAASRYMMETQNSTTAVSALMSMIGVFETDIARKKMKVIHQYYGQPRNISLVRSGGYAAYSVYDPKDVQDIDFEVVIKESPETPVARMMANDLVKELWQAGAITVEQMLRHGYFPGSEEILQELEAARESAEAQDGAVRGLDGGSVRSLMESADPEAVGMARRALAG